MSSLGVAEARDDGWMDEDRVQRSGMGKRGRGDGEVERKCSAVERVMRFE